MASFSVLPSSNQADKLFKDSWNSNPPQVTSYLTYPKTASLDHLVACTSPNCGLGWRFQIEETYEQAGTPGAYVQESPRRVDVTFQPHMCSSMPLSTARVNVRVSFPSGDAQSMHEGEFTEISLKSNQPIGSYRLPLQYEGQVDIEITLTFSDSDGLSFPTTSPPNATTALQQSLDASSFVDSKFYLFSAKVRGRLTRPRAVYAKSTLLTDRSPYLRDLLSSKMGDMNGTPCNLHEDVPEEVGKLDPSTFDYEEDSDLEDDTEEFDEVTTSKTKASNLKNLSPAAVVVNGEMNEQQCKSPDHFQDGRAYAINGTACKTWRSFIYYTYTNEIHFNELKSQQSRAEPRMSSTNAVSCSPKSMYRFAESANIPHLKSIAKASISKGLSQQNIITELFSVFTSRYKEIIELEVEFLLKNLTEDVADRFDDVLRTIVSGEAPYSFRVLAFTLRRLRGASAETAWAALHRHTPQSTLATPAGVSRYTSPAPMTRQEEKRSGATEEDGWKAATAASNETPLEVKKERKRKEKKGAILVLQENKVREKQRLEQETREAEECVVKEKAEREAGQEAKERAEREAQQREGQEVKEQAGEDEREVGRAGKIEEAGKAEGEVEVQAGKETAEKVVQETEGSNFTARKKAEQEAREKAEQEKVEQDGGERERTEKAETETAETEKGVIATGDGSGGGNWTPNFGGLRWGSSSVSGGGWGLGSWGEKGKSRAPNDLFAGAWEAPTSSGFGFDDGNGGPRLPAEELKLTSVGGEPIRNSSSLFGDLKFTSTTSNFADNVLDTPVTEHADDTIQDPLPAPSDEPLLDPRSPEELMTSSSVSPGYSSLVEIPPEIKERNKQAIITRAKIHELMKKIEELEHEILKAQRREDSGPLIDEIVLKRREIRKADRTLELLKRRAEQLYQAAVESTNQLSTPKILTLNFSNSSPEDAALRLEDILGLMFRPERKYFKLQTSLPNGGPGKSVKAKIQQVLSEYDIKPTTKGLGISVTVTSKAYLNLVTTFRQKHSPKVDE